MITFFVYLYAVDCRQTNKEMHTMILWRSSVRLNAIDSEIFPWHKLVVCVMRKCDNEQISFCSFVGICCRRQNAQISSSSAMLMVVGCDGDFDDGSFEDANNSFRSFNLDMYSSSRKRVKSICLNNDAWRDFFVLIID